MGRNPGFDLLRVLCIALIVWFHLQILKFWNASLTVWSAFVTLCTRVWFSVSVNTMAAMTGFFGVKSTRLNFFRLCTLYIQVRVYVLAGCLLGHFFQWINPDEWYYWYVVRFPILSCHHWYASAYLVLALISPGINSIARGLTRIQYIAAISLIFLLELNTGDEELNTTPRNVLPMGRGCTAAHLAIVYFLAGYFGLFAQALPDFCFWMMYCAVFCFEYCHIRDPRVIQDWLSSNGLGLYVKHFTLYFGVPIYSNVGSLALTLLTICVWKKVPISKGVGACVSFLGSLSFAVYLIHDTPPVVRKKLFVGMFRSTEIFADPVMAVPNVYRFTFDIFLVCAWIDTYRSYIWGVLTDGWWRWERWLGEFARRQRRRRKLSRRSPVRYSWHS
jgi:hypothetical protein